MTVTAHDTELLIARQRQRMVELRDDARDLAEAVADEVWDKFEAEIDDYIGDEYAADMPEAVQMGLSSALMAAYNEAFEHHVLGLFTPMAEQLRQALGEGGQSSSPAGFDTARLDLAGLRKGLKLQSHADALIAEALARVRPGVGGQIATVLGSLLRSVESEIEALDRDMREAARRAKRELRALRSPLRQRMLEDTRAAVGTARLGYVGTLDAFAEAGRSFISQPRTLKGGF